MTYYTKMVEKVQSALGSLVKMAQDLAAILDNELTQMNKGERGSWNGPLSQRLTAFNRLCTIFVKAELDPPALEEELWRASLPTVWDENRYEDAETRAKKIRARVREHLKGQKKSAAQKARALMETLVLFPECGGLSGRVDEAGIVAMLNRLLVDELGLDPYRPDYTIMPRPEPLTTRGPSRPIKVVVVDDGVDELMKSALALAGIPNLEVELFRYESKDRWQKVKGDELEAKLRETAQKVLERQPDIILMDEGLGDIDGHQLVPVIRREADGRDIVFVANTGGTPYELLGAGCYDNFSKGERLQGMLRALNSL